VTDARLAQLGGAVVLYDQSAAAAASVGVEKWFDADYWLAAGTRLDETTGRGAVLVLEHAGEKWVLRHYKRGGLVARFVEDHYLWVGRERTRAFREWCLLARLRDLGLPVPRPIAARIVRRGLLYQADIVTAYLPDTRPLSAHLNEGAPPREAWIRIGRMIRSFHDRGVDHPDLTAHNILIGPERRVFLVDFDNARIRSPGHWREAGLARLQRSLRKVALETGTGFDAEAWRALEQAYRRPEAAVEPRFAPSKGRGSN